MSFILHDYIHITGAARTNYVIKEAKEHDQVLQQQIQAVHTNQWPNPVPEESLPYLCD